MYNIYERFIMIGGKEGPITGHFVPNLIRLHLVKDMPLEFKIWYIKQRLDGWTIWFTIDETFYNMALERLDELKETRIFKYKTCNGF